MRHYIYSTTQIGRGWWDKYYDRETLEESAEELGSDVKTMLEEEAANLRNYDGVEFVCYLIAKPEYDEQLDDLSAAALYKDGNKYEVGYTYGSPEARLIYISQEEVEDRIRR